MQEEEGRDGRDRNPQGSADVGAAGEKKRLVVAMSQLWRVYTMVSQRELQLMGSGSLLHKV